MIREALKSGTEMGLKAKSYMDSGALVPDEVVIGIVKDRIAQPDCANGFVLDGFPRTIPQAEALDNMGVKIDRVIALEVSDDKIVKRMSGRRVCESCGASYHLLYNPPKVEGKCDKCGGTLVQRKDDLPETVKARLKVYHEQTEPLKDYYKRQGKLYTVDGQEDVAETTKLTLQTIEA
jgi:adenylate kinase